MESIQARSSFFRWEYLSRTISASYPNPMIGVTKEFINKALLLKNLPSPLFTKEGYISSLWQKEVRRDFIINVFIFITLLITYVLN
jgi:hypothetical protein